jgi:hypothetical protein
MDTGPKRSGILPTPLIVLAREYGTYGLRFAKQWLLQMCAPSLVASAVALLLIGVYKGTLTCLTTLTLPAPHQVSDSPAAGALGRSWLYAPSCVVVVGHCQ